MSAVALQEVIPNWTVPGERVAERLDEELLARAYRFSERAHVGQKRLSGEDYVSHCVEVAKILADLQLDSITVASGLIHDVVEDTPTTVAEVEREFGPEIASIVDGLTKIGTLPAHSTQERQVENYRKLLLSIAKDARVILIKLADRLHNMRTLEYLRPEKQRRIAQETRDLYAPLAHRFGMAKMRWELEDLAFKFLEPEDYRALAKLVAQKRGEREKLIGQLTEPLLRELRLAGIADVEVSGRPKHLWSIHKKMIKRARPYEEIYDLLAIRVLVHTVPECYHALGVIHDGWTPLQERIKDYIAQPKSNGYQSLHTTIFGPGRQLFEIQIRTRDMHRTAEFGIAAHWLYKDGAKNADDLERHLSWFRQVLQLQLDAKTPDEFLEFLKLDLYQDEIFVFTPTGDVMRTDTVIDDFPADTEQIGIEPGRRVLDLGCGWGPLLDFIRGREAVGVGVTLSRAQEAACRRHGLDVHLYDARQLDRESFGRFDAVASLGAFEHFCSVDEYRAGAQEEIYRTIFERVASVLPERGRFYLQTMIFGRNMIPLDEVDVRAPRDSDAFVLALMER